MKLSIVSAISPVKNVATFFTDQSQSFREIRIFENIALRRSAALAVERVSFGKSAGQSFIQARAKRPIIGNQFRHRKTLVGISNRRRQIIAQFEFPESFVQIGPGVHCSGHADRQHANRRNR
jgi:hypothetical protein